jgi:hypothetical protein
VAYVVWQRKKQQQGQPQSQQLRPLIDVEQIKTVGASLVSRLTLPAPATPLALEETPVETSSPKEPPHEKRLKNLKELHAKELISQTEYEAKRQQVLAEI